MSPVELLKCSLIFLLYFSFVDLANIRLGVRVFFAFLGKRICVVEVLLQ